MYRLLTECSSSVIGCGERRYNENNVRKRRVVFGDRYVVKGFQAGVRRAGVEGSGERGGDGGRGSRNGDRDGDRERVVMMDGKG